MSNIGEKFCPLCTEEMDLTDQQLKPCKCGYEICVWCWHHIMDVAEKDDLEGRCPACRTPYDKEKIVGMAANCERLVAETNSERKQKLQKPKPKAPEPRKNLGTIRVIQRNLVYIIGLPLNLADEDLLQCKDYFGQYGRVLKVSISRTSSGVIQHSANNSCCVYITYSKVEEAVRCIQSVNNFILEGRSLRALFGTTKYCHSWLRNLPCSNSDCLYLHDFGSQEDSFTKEEIDSASTWNRVQQITGATNNMQRRPGNSLPPPADEDSVINISSAGKPGTKGSSNNTEAQVRGSCTDGSLRRSVTLPTAASWVTCVSANQPPATNSVLNETEPTKKKHDPFHSPVVHLSEVVSKNKSTCTAQDRSKADAEKCDKVDSLELKQQYNSDMDASHINIMESLKTTSSIGSVEHFSTPALHKDHSVDIDDKFQRECLGFSSVTVHSHLQNEISPISNKIVTKKLGNHGLLNDKNEQCREPLDTLGPRDITTESNIGCSPRRKVLESIFHPQAVSCLSSLKQNEACGQSLPVPNPTVQMKDNEAFISFTSGTSVSSFRCDDNKVESPTLFTEKERGKYLRSDNDTTFENINSSDMGESCIIANILSMDLDSWDDSLNSPHSLVKLLPSPLKVENSNQSRFSFARENNFQDQVSDLEHFSGNLRHIPNMNSAPQDIIEGDYSYFERCQNFSTSGSFAGSDSFRFSPYVASSDNLSVPRARVSTPPGFSAPRKPPPPGFPSHERGVHALESSVNNLFQTPSPFSGSQFQAPPHGNVNGIGEVEFFDPAILEVGKGMFTTTGLNTRGSDFPTSFSQFNPLGNEATVQFLMQQSLSSYQNPRSFNHFGNGASSISHPMLLDQSRASISSPFSQLTANQFRNAQLCNGQWGNWNEAHAISENLSSGDLYNRRFGF